MDMKNNIQHVWFDMDGTLTVHTADFDIVHNELRYKAYSDVLKKPVTPNLIDDFNKMYKKCGSNSKVFTELGKPSDFWMQYFDQIDQGRYYEPVPEIYNTLDILRDSVKISLFTNAKLENTLRTLEVINIDSNWFTHVISGDDIKARKPALDGFRSVIEKSEIPAKNILYVGDRVEVDILPAKQLGLQTCLVYGTSKEADYNFLKFDDLLSLRS